jgi:phosphomannomutase/phosphoglucomutase
VNTIDGVRMAFPDGWGLIRASNTQPVLVLRFEATSEAALESYRREVSDWLAAQGVRL